MDLKNANKFIDIMPSTLFGQMMVQTFESLFYWEKILVDSKFRRIIEFGTYPGGLSVYLLLWCLERDAEFYTYDIKQFTSTKLKYSLDLQRYFRQKDIFKHRLEIIKLIQKPGQTILFCDNGNKKKEVRIFTKYMKRGDIIGIHDWNREINESIIKEVGGLDEIIFDGLNEFKTLIKFFRKR